MNDQLKQRLVGAIVLISLAVIFIPMILPGGGMSDSMNTRDAPPEPDYRFPPPKAAPKAPPMSEPVIVPMDDAEVKSSTTEKKALSKKTTDTKKTISSKSIAGASDKKPKVKPDQITAWIVQVGSFSNASNAKELQDKLRKMGYASFVEAVKTKKGMNYRVRVGPELTRTLADKLQKQLVEKAKLKGMVQSYP